MIATLLLAQILAAAPATTATPVAKADTGQTTLVAPPARVESQSSGTRTLADVARERKLGIKGVKGGGFSAAKSTVAPATSTMTDQDKTILKYGEPEKRNVTGFIANGKYYHHEQWIYSWAYLYFEDGRQTAVQSR